MMHQHITSPQRSWQLNTVFVNFQRTIADMPKKRKASILIDEYISNVPVFARPICRKLRVVIHEADPEITEDWKWGPNFVKKGMVCGFGAFNTHVSLAFFKGSLMNDPKNILASGASKKNNRVVKFTSEDQIDEEILKDYIREAVMINERGIKTPPSAKAIIVPKDLEKRLSANAKARINFHKMSYACRKEYVDWVTDARRDDTREQRIAEVVKRAASNQKLNE